MTPIYQTRFRNGEPGAPPGNCTQAALASIFELPLDAVPDFRSDANGKQVEKIAAFARAQGYEYRVMPSAHVYPPKGYHTISGVSPRGVRHLVVGYNGKIVHDPHPDGGGVVIDKYGFFNPLVLRQDQDKITQIRFRDTTTPSSISETFMPFDSRSLVGGLLGALVVGGVAAYTAKGKVRVPWIPLAAGAIGGTLAATYATWGETPRVGGVGAVTMDDVRDAKRRAKIATSEAREAREQTEVARGQRRQERERAKKGLTSIDVAQSEESAKREGYDVALMEGRADQFDDSENEDEDEGASAGVGRISIGRIRDLSAFSYGGDDDDDDGDDDDGNDDEPRQQRRAAPRGGGPTQEQALPNILAGAATATPQRKHQVRPGQQKGRPGPQGKRPGTQQGQRPPQGRPGPQGPGGRPGPAKAAAPKAEAEDEFPVLGFSAGGGAPQGGGGVMGGMFG